MAGHGVAYNLASIRRVDVAFEIHRHNPDNPDTPAKQASRAITLALVFLLFSKDLVFGPLSSYSLFPTLLVVPTFFRAIWLFALFLFPPLSP
jgi:hypothetical protein